MNTRMIKRHTRIAIFMHWFNAVCWLLLLVTGIGLIDNKQLQPLGMWLPNLMNSLFGGGENLLVVHEICGLIWATVFIIYGILFIKSEAIPFIKEIFSFSPKNDFLWLVKKGIGMTLGNKVLAKLGLDPELPPQGFYNVGQKMFAIPALLGGAVIVVTGVIMTFSKQGIASLAMIQWSILIHFITVGLVFAGLLVHIFMASIAKGELPALISMFSGTVPEDYAEHHHKYWYDEVDRLLQNAKSNKRNHNHNHNI